jgi:hypothetical protein
MSAPLATKTDPSAKLDWGISWAKDIAENAPGTTITTATLVSIVPATAVLVGGISHNADSVTWRLSCAAVPPGTDVSVTVHVVFSTGEEDERTRTVRVVQR